MSGLCVLRIDGQLNARQSYTMKFLWKTEPFSHYTTLNSMLSVNGQVTHRCIPYC